MRKKTAGRVCKHIDRAPAVAVPLLLPCRVSFGLYLNRAITWIHSLGRHTITRPGAGPLQKRIVSLTLSIDVIALGLYCIIEYTSCARRPRKAAKAAKAAGAAAAAAAVAAAATAEAALLCFVLYCIVTAATESLDGNTGWTAARVWGGGCLGGGCERGVGRLVLHIFSAHEIAM